MLSIKDVVDNYFCAWDRAFITKDPSEIKRFMSVKFVGYWAHSGLERPEQYDYHYDLVSVLKQYQDAKKNFEIESISSRKNGQEYIVMGRETAEISGAEYPAKCMFIWREENHEWKLIREYIELER
ncbi:nuclear transport factor 2 family protein [Bacillus haimaensis]|uniref:nuclear transport factor 2 family protein n=1 Tax=Bacillus haimaensis TaxID=3160967 RepID=UPI003AA87C5C